MVLYIISGNFALSVACFDYVELVLNNIYLMKAVEYESKLTLEIMCCITITVAHFWIKSETHTHRTLGGWERIMALFKNFWTNFLESISEFSLLWWWMKMIMCLNDVRNYQIGYWDEWSIQPIADYSRLISTLIHHTVHCKNVYFYLTF